MSAQWWALFRPGRSDPEAVDYDKSDLWSLALRRGMRKITWTPPEMTWKVWWGDGQDALTRQAAIKRLKRRGWRLEPMPEKFWHDLEPDMDALEDRALAGQEILLDLLRELAEDRHQRGVALVEGHHGTLRTCSDRLCMASADLLGRQ